MLFRLLMNKKQTVMNKNALYWIIALLVLLNIFTMFMLWQDHWDRKADFHNQRPGMFHQEGENKPEFIQRELDLSKEQTTRFRKYKKEHLKRVNQISEKIHNTKRLLLHETFSKNPDSLRVDSLINRIGNLQKKLEESNFTQINKMKEICNPKQLKKLEILFNEVMLKAEPKGRKRPAHNKQGMRKSKIKSIK